MKLQVPIEINLTEMQVRDVVRNYLKERYKLMKTDFEDRWVRDDTLFIVKYDTRGRPIGKTSEEASPNEIAAQTILNTLS